MGLLLSAMVTWRCSWGQDEKLYLYDGEKRHLHHDIKPPDLHDWLVAPAYFQVMRNLGEELVFDVGLPAR